MNTDSNSNMRNEMLLAMTGAGAMIAHQVVGKAARDGFFLQYYDVASIPVIVLVAAITSVFMAIGFSRLTERIGPMPLVPICFAVSMGLHFLEWLVLHSAPKVIAAVVYLHAVGLGAILISGFWLLLSEVFDVREAKQQFGRIAGAGIAGGVAGGIVAERLVASFSSEPLLLLLGLFHFACAVVSFRLRPKEKSRNKEQKAKQTTDTSSGNPFTRTPMLWQLASLIFLATSTAALLDYLFKLGATASIGSGPGLVRFFAIYHTACQAVTFLFQTYVAKSVVERLGIAKSVASLPFAIGLGSFSALVIPFYPFVVIARALEVILRGSVFRSGYEVLYSPVPASDKRAVKTIIDVGFDRLGDAVGAGAIQAMLWLAPALIRPQILGAALILSAVSTWLSLRLQRSYRSVVENALVDRARTSADGQQNAEEVHESLINTVFEGSPTFANRIGNSPLSKQDREVPRPSAAPEPLRNPLELHDLTIWRLVELRSRDAGRIQRALEPSRGFDALVVPQVIRLLAWDSVSLAAIDYLERGSVGIAGQLGDALRDQELDVAVRRRLPRLLARTGLQPSVETLIRALDDPRFEVRYQCGRALDFMKRRHEHLSFPGEAIWAAAGRELSVSQGIWKSRRSMKDTRNLESDFFDEVLCERADRSLEHVFSLFALVLPRKPLIAAFRALHHRDKLYRGLALEYLETSMPPRIRDGLWIVLEESAPSLTLNESERNEEEKKLLDALLETNARLLLRVEQQSLQKPPQDTGG